MINEMKCIYSDIRGYFLITPLHGDAASLSIELVSCKIPFLPLLNRAIFFRNVQGLHNHVTFKIFINEYTCQ